MLAGASMSATAAATGSPVCIALKKAAPLAEAAVVALTCAPKASSARRFGSPMPSANDAPDGPRDVGNSEAGTASPCSRFAKPSQVRLVWDKSGSRFPPASAVKIAGELFVWVVIAWTRAGAVTLVQLLPRLCRFAAVLLMRP